jgi:hypothetical protein
VVPEVHQGHARAVRGWNAPLYRGDDFRLLRGLASYSSFGDWLVADPLASHAADEVLRPISVRHVASRVPEVKLSEVAIKVLAADVVADRFNWLK